jgi:hypothetical protein
LDARTRATANAWLGDPTKTFETLMLIAGLRGLSRGYENTMRVYWSINLAKPLDKIEFFYNQGLRFNFPDTSKRLVLFTYNLIAISKLAIMQFSTTISSLFVLLSLTSAAPAEEKRQGKSLQNTTKVFGR